MDYFGSKPFDDINFTDLEGFVSLQIPESLTLDYKGDILRGGKKLKAAEFGKDFSSFANTFGGWLIYGVETDRSDEPKPLSQNPILGLEDQPGLKERIENLVLASVSPRPYFRLKKIPIPNTNRCVLLAYIPQSYQVVHMVTLKKEMRFYKRYNYQAAPMDVTEVHLRFESIALGQRVQEDTLARVRSQIVHGLSLNPENDYFGLYAIPRVPLRDHFNDRERLTNLLRSQHQHAILKYGGDPERRSNRFVVFLKFKGGHGCIASLSFYYDGVVAQAMSIDLVGPKQVDASEVYYYAYWFLHLVSQYYGTFGYYGFVDVFMEMKRLTGRELAFNGRSSYRFPKSFVFEEELGLFADTVETGQLDSAKVELAKQMVTPLFHSLNLENPVGCWEEDGTPKSHH